MGKIFDPWKFLTTIFSMFEEVMKGPAFQNTGTRLRGNYDHSDDSITKVNKKTQQQ